jgi:molybdenum cofactor cytidylyltransferase
MLADFLGIRKGDVVSFVGGGGKTSLMLALARELADRFKVVVTTTTRMGSDEIEGLASYQETKDLANASSLSAFYSKMDGRKVLGVEPEVIDGLVDLTDVVLVEADGSRRLPIKVPKAHEPVLPGSTTKLVVVYGFDGLDKPLTDENCYNLDGIITTVPGIEPGIQIEPPVLRRIFLEGGYLTHGEGKDVFAVVNKAEAGRDRATEFARELFHTDVTRIAVASANEQWVDPVDNQGRSITAVVLAAGGSKRFGENKLLMEVDGIPVVRKCLDSVKDAGGVDKIVLVTGHQSDILLGAVGDLEDVQAVHNHDHDSGMASSLKKGLEASGDAGGILVVLGDMPGITPELITRIINAYRNSCAWAIRPMVGDRPGHPVILGRELFPEVMGLEGDIGAKEVLARNKDRILTMDIDPGTQADIDTKEDYERLKGEQDNA